MKNIPFPNPHDADALNDYLDALAAGKQVSPDDEVQTAAAEMQALSNRSMPSIPEHSTGVHTGGETMPVAAYSPPISNRTRKERAPKSKPSRLEPWLSGLLVAGLLVSMIGYAWWNGPGGSDDGNDNLAWAPQTASPIAEEPFVWTAPISWEECPENAERIRYDPENPGGTLYTQDEYDQVAVERSYEIVGPADIEDAEAIVERTRESASCSSQAKSATLLSTVRYEYETRTTAGRESLDSQSEQRDDASAMITAWFATELDVSPQSMYVEVNPGELTVEPDTSLRTQPLYNPEMAVQFADGRIGVLRVFVSYEEYSEEHTEIIKSSDGFEVNMTIFTFQNGEWMIDEVLPVCIGTCELSPDGTPTVNRDLSATPVASPES